MKTCPKCGCERMETFCPRCGCEVPSTRLELLQHCRAQKKQQEIRIEKHVKRCEEWSKEKGEVFDSAGYVSKKSRVIKKWSRWIEWLQSLEVEE